MHLYIATTNPGKLRDLQYAAEQANAYPSITLEPLPNLHRIPSPEEDGDTLETNARLKAIYYSQHAPDQWVLADDSGLEVTALQNRPGVRSARFAQDLGTQDLGAGALGTVNPIETPTETPDQSNNTALLLSMLEQAERRARYRCALALARNGAVHYLAHGTLEGEILSDPEGSGGFGYDPLFFVPELNRTMAQATPAERLACSHRTRALRALLQQLAKF